MNTLSLRKNNALSDPFEEFNKMFDKFFLSTPDFSITNNTLSSFPPYNIYSHDGYTVLELACAGFSKDELSVSLIDNNKIRIIGHSTKHDPENISYSTRGIATRDFMFERTLMPDSEVENVSYENGILKIEVSKKNKEDSVKKLEIK